MCHSAMSVNDSGYIAVNHLIWFLLSGEFFMKLPLYSVYPFRYKFSNIFGVVALSLHFFTCRNIPFPR